MGGRGGGRVCEHRRDPTTRLTEPVRPRQSRPGEPQPGSVSRPCDVPEISPQELGGAENAEIDAARPS